MSRESKTLKKSSSWLNSSNALIQHLRGNAIFTFSVSPGSEEAQVNWCGIVKCLLIAYFIGNICVKKYQNPFTCVKVIASQRWNLFFETRCICTDMKQVCGFTVSHTVTHYYAASHRVAWSVGLSVALSVCHT